MRSNFLKRLLYGAALCLALAPPANAEMLWSGPSNTGLFNAQISETTKESLLVHYSYRDEDGTATWFAANGKNGGDADQFKGQTFTCRDGQPFGGTYRAPTCDVFGFLSVEWPSSQTGSTYNINVDLIGTIYLPNDRQKYGQTITPTVVEAGPGGGPKPRNDCPAQVSGTGACIAYHPDGWYWRSAEGGEGWSILFQGDSLFATVFTYGTDGRNTWKIATGRMTSVSSFSGALQSCRKPAGATSATCESEGNVSMTFRTVDNSPQANTSRNTKYIDVTLPTGKQFTLERFLPN